MATDAHQSATVRQPSAAELLTGPDAGDLLRVALREVGATVLSWRPNQVNHQPRRGSTAGYRVQGRWPDGQVSDERFAAYTGPAPARPEQAAVVLSLATGPYRVQQPDWQRATCHRVELVERWVASAQKVRRR